LRNAESRDHARISDNFGEIKWSGASIPTKGYLFTRVSPLIPAKHGGFVRNKIDASRCISRDMVASCAATREKSNICLKAYASYYWRTSGMQPLSPADTPTEDQSRLRGARLPRTVLCNVQLARRRASVILSFL